MITQRWNTYCFSLPPVFCYACIMCACNAITRTKDSRTNCLYIWSISITKQTPLNMNVFNLEKCCVSIHTLNFGNGFFSVFCCFFHRFFYFSFSKFVIWLKKSWIESWSLNIKHFSLIIFSVNVRRRENNPDSRTLLIFQRSNTKNHESGKHV